MLIVAASFVLLSIPGKCENFFVLYTMFVPEVQCTSNQTLFISSFCSCTVCLSFLNIFVKLFLFVLLLPIYVHQL